jgi:transglutaminase-like putative cysteine protease
VALAGFDESELDHLRALAQSVTSGAGSAFERGLQLETWFHSDAFAYSTATDPGFDGASIVSWLLDPESPQYHVGYAEQFSVSLAILARTLDIPSRVVLGFAPGELADGETTVIRDRGAHSWVELWIPQQGWMRFDPTPRSAGDGLPTHQALVRELGFQLDPYLTR